MIAFRSRRYDEGIRFSQRALDLDPSFVNALWWEGFSYAGKNDFKKAIACLTKAVAMNNGPMFRALLGHLYGRSGDSAKALAILGELTIMANQKLVSPMDFAMVYAGMGDERLTFQWLEKAYQSRATRIHEIRSMEFDRFRSDPRLADLVRLVGFPPSPKRRSNLALELDLRWRSYYKFTWPLFGFPVAVSPRTLCAGDFR